MIVAVSGGADSTALLVAFASLAPEFALTPIAAHLHHGLRGAEADADLAHVRALCERLVVRLVVGRRRGGPASETTLRGTRRRFLARVRERLGATLVLTAHTANDQLETLLFRLARGAGLRGLAGMAPRQGRFAKPLLEVTRADLVRDLGRAGVPWREDASNAELGTPRNRIRHIVVPALARAVSGQSEGAPLALARHAARAAAEARAAERALAAMARLRRARHATTSTRLPIAAFRGPLALRRAIARAFWQAATRQPTRGRVRAHEARQARAASCEQATPGPLVAHVDAILAAARPGRDRVWTMAGGWRLERRGPDLQLLAPVRAAASPARPRRATGLRLPV